jgi:hypothetical protein
VSKYRAGDEVRTRDLQLGRLPLYQLSYSRNNLTPAPLLELRRGVGGEVCGGNRIRTYEVIRQQIYSLSQLAALVFPRNLIPIKKRTLKPVFLDVPKKQECKIIRFYTFSKLKPGFSSFLGRK